MTKQDLEDFENLIDELRDLFHKFVLDDDHPKPAKIRPRPMTTAVADQQRHLQNITKKATGR